MRCQDYKGHKRWHAAHESSQVIKSWGVFEGDRWHAITTVTSYGQGGDRQKVENTFQEAMT